MKATGHFDECLQKKKPVVETDGMAGWIKMAFVECCQGCETHRNNINRYERLLKTYLTDIERNFIELRLWEEHVALRQNQKASLNPRLTPGTPDAPKMWAGTRSG